jgi:hypothetical protein
MEGRTGMLKGAEEWNPIRDAVFRYKRLCAIAIEAVTMEPTENGEHPTDKTESSSPFIPVPLPGENHPGRASGVTIPPVALPEGPKEFARKAWNDLSAPLRRGEMAERLQAYRGLCQMAERLQASYDAVPDPLSLEVSLEYQTLLQDYCESLTEDDRKNPVTVVCPEGVRSRPLRPDLLLPEEPPMYQIALEEPELSTHGLSLSSEGPQPEVYAPGWGGAKRPGYTLLAHPPKPIQRSAALEGHYFGADFLQRNDGEKA